VSGPAFLLVYAVLATLANLWLRQHLRRREAAKPARFLEFAQDPYLVAYLREGAEESTRLAIFSLIDRGLLEEAGGAVRSARADAEALARRPIEKAVLSCCSEWTRLDRIEGSDGVLAACRSYRDELGAHALLANDQVYAERFKPYLATLAVVLGVALVRIWWALAQGRHNIGFLIVMAIAGAIGLAIAFRRRRTGLGDAAIARLKVLFANLKRNSSALLPGGENNDAVLTAACFGMVALPADRFPYLDRVFPKPQSSGGDGGGGDSGSSGGNSGSGGCGGGGCGGCGG
jgi:uncharacterized protein (TIGR04222 family)